MDDDFEPFEDTRSMLSRFEAMVDLTAEKHSKDHDLQYAYKYGMIMQQLRSFAYQHPEVAEELAKLANSMEKKYVVDVLSNDATVKS